jgi:hypothetical protein
MTGFGPLLVFAASFVNKQSYWRLGPTDYLCSACSVLALVLWRITSNPSVAIVFEIASDGLAALPTLIKRGDCCQLGLWGFERSSAAAERP